MEFQDTLPLGDAACGRPGSSAMPPATPPAAPPADAPAAATRTGPHPLPIEFTGSGSEYFRIWIVNLLLTVVTLGLYYPFAKARRLRYFHGNTRVGGHALGFHGDPWRMLRGYLLMVVFGAAYLGSGHFSPVAGAVAALLFALMWPALWQASLRFRLANTSWRGLRLRFGGSLGGAYAALMPLIVPFLFLVLAGAFDPPGRRPGETEPDEAPLRTFVSLLALFSMVALLVLLPWLFARLKRYQHGHYQFARETSRLEAPTRAFYGLMLRAFGVSLLPLALIGVAFAMLLPSMKQGGVDAASGGATAALAVLLMGAAYLLMLVLTQSFLVARGQNLVWGATRSHRLRFSSGLRVRAMVGLMLTNLLLTVVTFGLYRPFAAVATARLRLQAMALEAHGDVDQWTAGATGRASDATGEAAGDLFGIDVGL